MFRKWQKTNPNYPIILGFMPAYRIYGYRHPIAIETCNYYWTATFLLNFNLIVVLQNCGFRDEGANSKKSYHHWSSISFHTKTWTWMWNINYCGDETVFLVKEIAYWEMFSTTGVYRCVFPRYFVNSALKNFKTRWNCLMDPWSFASIKNP